MQPDVERELIRKCRSGEHRFFEPLVRAYEVAGLRLAVAMLGNIEDAEDVLQEAFLKAYSSLESFEDGKPFGPWFFQILRNRCRDQLRRRKARFARELLDEPDPATTIASDATHPERIRQKNAARELLWRGLGEISADHREVIVLKELQGFRYGEIGEMLGVPEGTVASRLFNARTALRDAIIRLGGRDT
ncbi:MAG: RNA polymerase sigma factor [Gemmatimonadetes bacterium]|nr:RNA polymerase sigma factor [Gemmatimonadota bacterium]